jgi:hypothetical protein
MKALWRLYGPCLSSRFFVDILMIFSDVEANTNLKGFTLLLNEAEVKESLFNSMMEVKAEKAAKFKNEWEKSIIKGVFVV